MIIYFEFKLIFVRIWTMFVQIWTNYTYQIELIRRIESPKLKSNLPLNRDCLY